MVLGEDDGTGKTLRKLKLQHNATHMYANMILQRSEQISTLVRLMCFSYTKKKVKKD